MILTRDPHTYPYHSARHQIRYQKPSTLSPIEPASTCSSPPSFAITFTTLPLSPKVINIKTVLTRPRGQLPFFLSTSGASLEPVGIEQQHLLSWLGNGKAKDGMNEIFRLSRLGKGKAIDGMNEMIRDGFRTKKWNTMNKWASQSLGMFQFNTRLPFGIFPLFKLI